MLGSLDVSIRLLPNNLEWNTGGSICLVRKLGEVIGMRNSIWKGGVSVFVEVIGFMIVVCMDLLPVSGAIADNTSVKAMAPALAKESVKARIHGPSSFWMKIQKSLIAHGAKIKEDGYVGRQTRQAIRSFQKKHNLKPTGRINKVTMQILEPCPPHCRNSSPIVEPCPPHCRSSSLPKK